MDTASKVLIMGGMVNLVYALLTGLAVAKVRTGPGAPQAPRYLMLVHTGAIFQGTLLLALTLALVLSDLSSGLETLAAWLTVGATVAVTTGNTINWLTGVKDEIAERAPGFYFGIATAVLSLAGVGIIFVGAIKGL